jgi:hypothetical protein
VSQPCPALSQVEDIPDDELNTAESIINAGMALGRRGVDHGDRVSVADTDDAALRRR